MMRRHETVKAIVGLLSCFSRGRLRWYSHKDNRKGFLSQKFVGVTSEARIKLLKDKKVSYDFSAFP